MFFWGYILKKLNDVTDEKQNIQHYTIIVLLSTKNDKTSYVLKELFSAFEHLKKTLFTGKLPTEFLFKSPSEYVCFDRFLYLLKALG